MTVYRIPITGASEGPFYIIVDLSGTNYQLDFHFNLRDGAWYMSVLDTEGNQMRSGLKVVVNWRLLRRWVSALKPPGILAVVDYRIPPEDPTESGLGAEGVLLYNE